MKALSKTELVAEANKPSESSEDSLEAFRAFEAREDVRAVFVKIHKSKNFTREAAERAFAHVRPAKK